MRPQSGKSRRSDCLQKRCGAGTRNAVLHHVADVEERCVAACEVMGGADRERIVLYWHVEAAEGNHFSSMEQVEVVERCFAKFACRWSSGCVSISQLRCYCAEVGVQGRSWY